MAGFHMECNTGLKRAGGIKTNQIANKFPILLEWNLKVVYDMCVYILYRMNSLNGHSLIASLSFMIFFPSSQEPIKSKYTNVNRNPRK